MVEDDPDGHVNYQTFGHRLINDRERFYQLIVQTRKMDGYSATLALRECYETQYGIFNHDNRELCKNNPLALVAMHPKEDAFHYSMLHRYMWRYRQYDIGTTWHLSWLDFMQLPWAQVQAIFRIEQKRAQEQLKRDEDLRRQDNAMQRDMARESTRNAATGKYTPSTPKRIPR